MRNKDEIKPDEISLMRKLNTSGALNRRDFMHGMMAASAVGTGLLGGSIPSSAFAQNVEPKRGGRLRVAFDSSSASDTLDPARAVSGIDQTRVRVVYNGLLRLDENLSVGPELATEYSVSDDGLTYTFRLRSGVVFHDGTPFSADDVVYSMMRHIGPDSTSSARALVANVQRWEKVDNLTVRAVLESPNTDFPVILGATQFKIIRDGTSDFTMPLGTGPFRLQEFSPGVRTLALRNEDYWGDGGPYLDEIEMISIADAAARINALTSGDVDLIANVDPQSAPIVEGARGVLLLSIPTGSFPNIDIRRDRGPGLSLDFIKGVQLLQRREDIVQGLFGGNALVAADQPIGPFYGADHDETLEPLPYDPDQARFYLQRSGVEGAVVHVADINPGIMDIVLLLQNEARRIDYPIEVRRVPNDGYWSTVWGREDIAVSRWNMRPTAALFYGLAYVPGGAWNSTHWSSDRMAQLIHALPRETDPALRREMHAEAQRLIQAESGHVIPAFVNFLDGHSDRVKGLTRVPTAPIGGGEWPEFVWLDD